LLKADKLFFGCQLSKNQIYKENGGLKVQANIELYSSKKLHEILLSIENMVYSKKAE
jgi:hypothetical protein